MKTETVAVVPPPSTNKVTITAPNIKTIVIPIQGRPGSPYVSNRFGSYAQEAMMNDQLAGSTARSKKKRAPKDFDRGYKDSLWVSKDGWYGINASAFRSGAISACRIVGFKMTLAKLSIFVIGDGESADGTSLVRIHGEPHMAIDPVRNSNGTADLRARAKFADWSVNVKVEFDADQFTEHDVVNLFSRIGQQVGVGAGRPDSRESAGQGWGMFTVMETKAVKAA